MYCKNTLEASIKKALSLGYKPYHDPKAFTGISYRNKKHQMWILLSPGHLLDEPSIKAMNIVDEEDLQRIGYNVDDFYKHHPDALDHEAMLRAELDSYNSERRQNINEIYGNANIDPDEVDDDYEQLSQLGFDYSTLKRDKNDDFEETEEVTNIEEFFDPEEDTTDNDDSEPKIYVWHSPDERKKMKHK